MKTSTVAAVAAGISSLLCAEQNTNEVATLPPVTVYASRTGSTKDEMPAAVQLFTAAEIEASGAKDLPELLKKKAGIDVQNMNGNPVLTMLAARGFGENAFGRIKVMMDGAELNNVDMAPPPLPESLLSNICSQSSSMTTLSLIFSCRNETKSGLERCAAIVMGRYTNLLSGLSWMSFLI